ncbi:class I SAM-dependent methyltransferase [Roseibium sediminicola]|uniref:Class I SAM-dependent methyltransferase n=1 Tax=Roseibium sediminicola TaxID=2933272 RepID=A0ABT0GVA1_9HYPH|nr:class I SAM-dependent methyltransferase [Roseibium sp. CAU 1639]MCK7613366.1 class I SAM-dependent methyltransferase [Roseibium sp. CAU 1639]
MTQLQSVADTPAAASEALDMFQYEWGIYHKLVRANEMHHRELGQILRRLIETRFDRPFTFLDLACGDASLARCVLKGSKVSRYEGIDLSRPALKCAAEVMAEVPFAVTLSEEDMRDAVLARPQSCDIIWCGFSIHHLDRAQKQDMLLALRGALRPGGIFVCAEPVCRASETRSQFTSRWEGELRRRFSSLTEREYAHLWNHIRTYDYPEPPEDWIAMGERAGFSRVQELFRFPGDLFCSAFLFER